MKSLQQHISEKLIVFHPQVDEKLVINKNYKPSSSERPFDEIISSIEGLRRDGKYHVIDPKNHFNIDMPSSERNKKTVEKTFKKMEMCILYNTKICDRKLYTEAFNKCTHAINNNNDDLNIVMDEWDGWSSSVGYTRLFTIVEDPDDMVVMIVNDSENIDNTYILVGM